MAARNPRCRYCHEPIFDDGYGDVVHDDGLYMCNNDKGTVATR